MNHFTIMIVDGPWHKLGGDVIIWTLKWYTGMLRWRTRVQETLPPLLWSLHLKQDSILYGFIPQDNVIMCWSGSGWCTVVWVIALIWLIINVYVVRLPHLNQSCLVPQAYFLFFFLFLKLLLSSFWNYEILCICRSTLEWSCIMPHLCSLLLNN